MSHDKRVAARTPSLSELPELGLVWVGERIAVRVLNISHYVKWRTNQFLVAP